MSQANRLFAQHVQNIPSASSHDRWLTTLVRKELEELVMLSDEWTSSGCLLADIGEFLRQATGLLSQLAAVLANGGHVQTYAKVRLKEMSKQTDFSDLRHVDYMNAQHNRIRSGHIVCTVINR